MLKDFVIPLQSKPGAYLLAFLGGSAECFLQLAPGYMRAMVFSCQPLTHREPHRSIAFTGRNSCSRFVPEERPLMSLRDFITKQFIDVIEWVEPEEGILSYRYPMTAREIQNGGKLTVRDSQAAVFVNEIGRASCRESEWSGEVADSG